MEIQAPLDKLMVKILRVFFFVHEQELQITEQEFLRIEKVIKENGSLVK